MSRAAALLVVALVACKGGGGEDERIPARRSGDAGPPVVIVDDPRAPSNLAREKEPNDDAAKPAALALPGGVEGGLAVGDLDAFGFTATKAGAVAVRVQPAADLDVIVEVHGKGVGTAAKPLRSDRGPAGILEGLPDVPVVAGERYVVVVSRFVKAAKKPKGKKGKKGPPDAGVGSAPTAPPPTYQLTVAPVEAREDLEREPNEDVAAPRTVLLGDAVEGWIGWTGDVDVWAPSTAGFTATQVLDLGLESVEGVALAAQVLVDGQDVVQRRGGKGEGVAVRGLVVASGQRLALRVLGTGSNPELAYRLTARSREVTVEEEREPNDAEEGASTLPLTPDAESGAARGFLDGGDVDLWRVGAGDPTVLEIRFTPPPGVDGVLRVLAPGGRELARADEGRAGAVERLRDLPLGRGADLVVEVTGKGPADVAEGYSLAWSSYPGAPPPPAPSEPEPSDE